MTTPILKELPIMVKKDLSELQLINISLIQRIKRHPEKGYEDKTLLEFSQSHLIIVDMNYDLVRKELRS